MFDNLSDRLSGVFDKLKGRGALKEQDVRDAMREVRIALLEADVALPIAKKFIEDVKKESIGKEIIRSITPAQMITKIVNDQLIQIFLFLILYLLILLVIYLVHCLGYVAAETSLLLLPDSYCSIRFNCS